MGQLSLFGEEASAAEEFLDVNWDTDDENTVEMLLEIDKRVAKTYGRENNDDQRIRNRF